MRVRVNADLCAGTADCEAIAPRVFRLGPKRKAQVRDPGAEMPERLWAAARACPTRAIVLEDEVTGKRLYP